MSEMQRGIVKWFNDAKGFGFIEHETGKDVFVHYSVIEADGFKTLKDGEVVEYELSEGDKGLHAARVIRTNPPPAAKKGPKKGFTGALAAGAGAGDDGDGSDSADDLSSEEDDDDSELNAADEDSEQA